MTEFAAKTALAVSAFRNDDGVRRVLEALAVENPFAHVIVVDSLGSGAIRAAIDELGLGDRVTYENATVNLGAAGNLDRRLALAAATDADFVYALNGDTHLDVGAVAKLVGAARRIDRIGAAYPARRFVRRDGRIEGESRFAREHPPIREVEWQSSNGALYALAPVRAGVRPYVGVWHGWEDLAWGYVLHDAGYRQIVVREAVFDDEYEYRRVRLGPCSVAITEKPAWMTYYQGRNLVLVATKVRPTARTRGWVGYRIVQEIGVTSLLRDQKARRLGYLARGVVDGLRGRTGKWDLP